VVQQTARGDWRLLPSGESGLGAKLDLSGECHTLVGGSPGLPWRFRTVESSLAFGLVVCRGGPLQVLGSGLGERVSEREGPQERLSERGSPREPSIRVPPPRERRHGHGLLVRDVLPGPPSRAEDELGWIEGVHALRRAVSSLSRLPDGGNRADLCSARGLADARSSLPASKWARSRESERPPWHAPRRSRTAQSRERTVICEATCRPTTPHLVASRRERRPSRRRCRLTSGPRLCRRADRTTR